MNPLKVIAVYSRLYAECLKKALRGIRKSAWTVLLPGGLDWLAQIASDLIFAALPRDVAGFVFAAVVNLLSSAYLYFVEENVSNSKVEIREFPRAFGRYFWSLMSVGFFLWIFKFLLGSVLAGNANGRAIWFVIFIVATVLLSALPEVLYQRNVYGYAALPVAINFLQENWIEWLLPHAILAGLVYLGLPLMVPLVRVGWIFNPGDLITLAIGGAIFHVFMVFRGHLFEVLSSSTHRQRMFRYRGNA